MNMKRIACDSVGDNDGFFEMSASPASSCKSDLLFGTIVTAEGQVKVGDKLKITGKNDRDSQTATVMDILSVNGREEVLINVERNYYFITELLISGQSWAGEVRIISAE